MSFSQPYQTVSITQHPYIAIYIADAKYKISQKNPPSLIRTIVAQQSFAGVSISYTEMGCVFDAA